MRLASMSTRIALLLALPVGLAGCGGQTALVTGKVTTDGKEVTGGTLVLSPLDEDGKSARGRPGLADLGGDGTFKIELESGPDGLAQKCTVRYTPPPVSVTAAKKDAVIPYAGLVPKESQIDIKPGANTVNIELVPAPRKK